MKHLQGKIDNLTAKLGQVGDYISADAKADIKTQISELQATLNPKMTQLQACQNKDASIKKIDAEIKDSIDGICKQGLHIPKPDTFLYTVLSQYDPSKHPCGTAEKMSVASRVKECGDVRKLANGQTVSVVSRSVLDSGQVQEYLRDDASGLTWGPQAPKDLSWEDAKNYCANLKDLGLSWHLPSQDEFLKAMNKGNQDQSYNKDLTQVVPDMKDKWFWSSSPSPVSSDYAYSFNGDYGSFVYFSRNYTDSVRCVSR